MKLLGDEQNMLEGKEGLAKQKALELLTKFGDALGAERLVDTDNVLLNAGLLNYLDFLEEPIDMDDIASKFYLDSKERVVIDRVKAFTLNHIFAADADNRQLINAPPKLVAFMEAIIAFAKRVGIKVTGSCTPYQCGDIPTFGEHCAWVESSAVPFINSVLGARTNVEGLHSAWASAITGKTLYWGRHLDENRRGTLLVNVETDPGNVLDWGLLGYYIGAQAGLEVPVYHNIKRRPNMTMLMALSGAGAASGAIEMYHIVGITPEAPTIERATHNRKPKLVINYGREQRQQTYEKVNSSTDENVDLISLGCPHYTLWQLGIVARLLEGKKVHESTTLLIYTAKQLKTVADRSGYTDIIEKAGGHVVVDSCFLNIFLPKINVVATDSVKAAHYLANTPLIQTPTGTVKARCGTVEDCIQAAITGKWRGQLK